MTRKLVLSANAAWNIANFRAGLIRGLQAAGWEVVAMAPRDAHVARVEALGCRFVELPMHNTGTHPGRDLQLLWRYRRLLAVERPDAFLGFTIKPNIYGSLAARSLGIAVVNNIGGLGTAFLRRGWLTVVARRLYRAALAHSHCVLFQNAEDLRYFVGSGLVDARRTGRVPGSGVDLDAFSPAALPASDTVRFLMIARLLRDKGVAEFADAAQRIRARGLNAEFALLGFADDEGGRAVTRTELDAWQADGRLRYLGSTDDVRPHIEAAHCVVLPSYREGVPRTLLEAGAMARPLIATDVPGCRDAVDDGINGFLARPRDGADLAAQCERFIALPPAARLAMGAASRAKIEAEFDEREVVKTYLSVLDGLRASRAKRAA